eukprot:scaffold6592_cov411-Prasinococcus_capsulatus_cf.AAC.12
MGVHVFSPAGCVPQILRHTSAQAHLIHNRGPQKRGGAAGPASAPSEWRRPGDPAAPQIHARPLATLRRRPPAACAPAPPLRPLSR